MKATLLMKRTLLVVTAATGMVACGNKSQEQKGAQVIFADTTGLAEFQQWKAINERKDANTYYMQPAVQAQPVARRSSSSNSGSMNTATTNTAKKKGMSKAAKGAIIGGASGAVLGAVINKKNRVVGGVIGGVLGGGIGYGIGRGQDKKDGRY